MERIAVWLLSLPLMLGGSAVAHWAAYRIAYAAPAERGAELAGSGHGYLAHAPQALAVAAAVLAVAFVVRAATARATSARGHALSLLPFAALPPLAFAVQEHLERLIHDGALPLHTATEPTFLIGLALQLPFALVAFGLARLLLQMAERVARARRVAPPRRRPAAPLDRRPVSAVLEPAASPLALARPLRGPPAALLTRS